METTLSSTIHSAVNSNVFWNKDNGDYTLRPSDVHVWNVKVPDYFNDLFKSYRYIVTPEEFERAKAFHWEKDYRSYLTGRMVLRILFSKYLNKPICDIHFNSVSGKPSIFSKAQLKYNLSYAGQYILISIGLCETGIDIESIKHNFDFKDILSTCFSKEEIDFIDNDQGATVQKFFLHWTRKEALLKYTGQGIIDDLATIPTLNGCHSVGNDIVPIKTDINLLSFNLNYSCVGTLAYPKAISNIKYLEWQ